MTVFINTSKIINNNNYKFYFKLQSDSNDFGLIDFGFNYVNLPKKNLKNNKNEILKEKIKILEKKIKIILEDTKYSFVKIVKLDRSNRIPLITIEIKEKTKENKYNEYHKKITEIKKQTGSSMKRKILGRKLKKKKSKKKKQRK